MQSQEKTLVLFFLCSSLFFFVCLVRGSDWRLWMGGAGDWGLGIRGFICAYLAI